MFETYITAVNSVIADIVNNVEEFSYIDPEQITVNFKKSREGVGEEVWAEITGLSEENYGSVQQRRKNGNVFLFQFFALQRYTGKIYNRFLRACVF